MSLALINGQAYDHANVRVNIAGVQVFGVKSVMASKSVPKTNNPGIGGEPVSRGRGDVEYESSITLSMVDIERIRAAAPARDLTNISPFVMVVTFRRGLAPATTCTIYGAEFTTDGFSSENGSTDLELELPLTISGFQWS